MRFPGFRKGLCTSENGSNYRENAFSIWKSALSQGENAFSFSQPFLRRVKMHFLFGNWRSRKVKMLFPFFATIFTIFTSCLGDVFESFAIHAICFSKQNKRHTETTLISNKNPRDPRDPWRQVNTPHGNLFHL